ncbi:phosphotriesterase family protein [Fontibacter flavus]|uniref:Phosphotriesterase n=1 Tax=Fontibacter flavus TaxID=654838 RepID=A0ABV6FYU3_9BACT
MKKTHFLLLFLWWFSSCGPSATNTSTKIITVEGDIKPDAMGITLIHEHVLVDFIGADSTGFHRWDKDEVVSFLTPYIEDAKKRGVRTMVECTPSFLGKDPELLKMLSEKTGMQFLTNVGFYGAVSGKYLPPYAKEATAEELADIWVKEFVEGIGDTGIKPGFIKISVNEGAVLSEMDQKLVKAAALTHLQTGLLIVSHTGIWKTANPQIELLKSMKVDPQNFVWVHAQNEQDFENYRLAVKQGVWISLDGVVWDVQGHLERLEFFRDQLGLDRVLISHDAGWYSPGKMDQGDFKGYTGLFDELLPKLKENGFSSAEINKMLMENPRKAFAVKRY